MTENSGADIEGALHSKDGKGIVRMKARYQTDIEDLWSAVTDPRRLASWYGKVEGDLRVGGEFTVFVAGSGWEGRGHVDKCVPPQQLQVTKWEEEGVEEVVSAELVADGDHTILVIEVAGLPLDKLYAYGAGWQAQVEDLAAHLAGQEGADWLIRWGELAPSYREMKVVPLEH
ncbi:MAG: SRPBCC domain-containing protein [Candidatus Dormiibacterota bacterium]